MMELITSCADYVANNGFALEALLYRYCTLVKITSRAYCVTNDGVALKALLYCTVYTGKNYLPC
jgi:hypothetical protein